MLTICDYFHFTESLLSKISSIKDVCPSGSNIKSEDTIPISIITQHTLAGENKRWDPIKLFKTSYQACLIEEIGVNPYSN